MFIVFADEGSTDFCHGDGIATPPLIALEVAIEVINGFWLDVVFANRCCSVAVFGQENGQTANAGVRMKVVVAVLMSVLTIGVVVESAEDDGATRAATGGGAEGVGETGSLAGELVEVWGLNDRITVTTGIESLVVDDEENDVSWRDFVRLNEDQREQEAETGKDPFHDYDGRWRVSMAC